MSEPWVTRVANASDLSGLGYLWLKSSEGSRDAREYGAGWWAARSPLVDQLLRDAHTRVIADPAEPSVFWAFSCVDGEALHYACIKREFWKWRERLQAALLAGLMATKVTHELTPETGIVVPETWKLDRYWGWR